MRIQKLHIKNFRYIRSLEICDIQNALILVGKNNVGKSAVSFCVPPGKVLRKLPCCVDLIT